MKLLKHYPGQKITLDELKWQQQEYCNALHDLYSILNPSFFSTSGHGLTLHTRDSNIPHSIVGLNGTTNVVINIDNPYMHSLTFGYHEFADTFQFTSLMFEDEDTVSAGYQLDWAESLINTGESSATDGWLNFFFQPVYYGYSVAAEMDKYLDSIVANRGGLDSSNSQTTYTADGQQIIPYLVDGPITDTEAERTVANYTKVYKSENPFGANDFSTNFDYWSLQPYDGDSSNPIVIQHKHLVTYLYSIYWDSGTQTYSSGGYHKLIYQPIVGASMVRYDNRLESPQITVIADTLQKLFDRLQTVFSAYVTALDEIRPQILSGAYVDATFISEISSDPLLSGYTENAKFPAAIGTRYDS